MTKSPTFLLACVKVCEFCLGVITFVWNVTLAHTDRTNYTFDPRIEQQL
jgi:hypothetical protein